MINAKYLFFLLLASVTCAVIVGPSYLRGDSINIYAVVCSFVFGLSFMPFVVARLPVFKNFYGRDINDFDRRRHDLADRKAAPVMVSVVTGTTLALVFYMINFEDSSLPSFCGAVAAGIISFYYEPRF